MLNSKSEWHQPLSHSFSQDNMIIIMDTVTFIIILLPYNLMLTKIIVLVFEKVGRQHKMS